ncbi:hypothetical protein P692DRAFT_20930431 [Suillus brevipes Sb2]|nr:hypothetical protein P692DRAFT_20930431 [Suillus brevipes Sb2]
MPIPLFQGFGKVIAFRLKRPKQKRRTQHNSTTTNHEGISSIPANIGSNPVPALCSILFNFLASAPRFCDQRIRTQGLY